jgi:hypothetical protein
VLRAAELVDVTESARTRPPRTLTAAVVDEARLECPLEDCAVDALVRVAPTDAAAGTLTAAVAPVTVRPKAVVHPMAASAVGPDRTSPPTTT